MIQYESRCGIGFILKILQARGSVFPKALCVSLPCALCSALLKELIDKGVMDRWLDADHYTLLLDAGAWNGFAFLVGFLIVFRTSQSYSRFWDGSVHTHRMHAEWFDSCSNLIAFCVCSKADEETTSNFKHLIIRMFSLLHVLALAEIEDTCKEDIENVNAFRMELIDVHGVDPYTLKRIKDSDSKVELVFTWIQQLIVANITTGVMSIPPPILSRVFQELSNGMVAFEQAMKITLIPFPFPYAQTCDCLMIIHWLVMPLIVAQWATHPFWAGVLVFIQVFMLWSLSFIAVELENPFGRDDNDLDSVHLQIAFNRHLSMLIVKDEEMLPQLLPTALKDTAQISCAETRRSSNLASAWQKLNESSSMPMRSANRRTSRMSTIEAVVRRISSGGKDERLPNPSGENRCTLDRESRQREPPGAEAQPGQDRPASRDDIATERPLLTLTTELDLWSAGPLLQELEVPSRPMRAVSPPPGGNDATNMAPTMLGSTCGAQDPSCAKAGASQNSYRGAQDGTNSRRRGSKGRGGLGGGKDRTPIDQPFAFQSALTLGQGGMYDMQGDWLAS